MVKRQSLLDMKMQYLTSVLLQAHLEVVYSLPFVVWSKQDSTFLIVKKYFLMHRSQADPLYDDERASNLILEYNGVKVITELQVC